MATLICCPKAIFKQTDFNPTPHKPQIPQTTRLLDRKLSTRGLIWNPKPVIGLVGSVLVLGLAGSASASELPPLVLGASLQLSEPGNALSLPTWAIHVSSVVEWITAIALVWQYGEKSGFESWKGLSWGMVPLLGGAFCACTWHFFYNSESLEGSIAKETLRLNICLYFDAYAFTASTLIIVLVALQAALTVIGNATMCVAAYRICKSSDEQS